MDDNHSLVDILGRAQGGADDKRPLPRLKALLKERDDLAFELARADTEGKATYKTEQMYKNQKELIELFKKVAGWSEEDI